MKKHLLIQFYFATLFTIIALSGRAQTYVNVPITGFNQDLVANGVGAPSGSTSLAAGIDGSNYVIIDNTYKYSSGCATGVYTTNVYPSGGTIASTAASGLNYTLQSSTGSNAIRVPATGTGSGSATITLTTPIACQTLYLLSMSDGGTVTITVNFTGGTTQVFSTLSTENWCTNGTTGSYTTISTTNYYRVTTNAGCGGLSTCEYFGELTLALLPANYQKTVASITVTQNTSGDTYTVWALGAKPYTAVAVPVTGFNADVVANGSGTSSSSTTTDLDGTGGGYDFVATNFNPGSGVCTSGADALPASNTITSTQTGITYTLQNYTGNNDLKIASGSNGTLTFTTPIYASTVYVVCLGGNGALTFTPTITYADGSTSTPANVSVADWCGNGANQLTSQEYYRVPHGTATTCSGGGDCEWIYEVSITGVNVCSKVSSIKFANNGSGILNVLAIGAQPPTTVAASGTLVSVQNCNNPTATLTLTGSSGSIQFQTSPNPTGGPWTNYGTAGCTNSITYTPSATTYFQAVVTAANGSTATSNTVTTAYNPVADQVTYGTNGQWIGYIYNSTGTANSFTPSTYLGWMTEGTSGNPNFSESFGGSTPTYPLCSSPVGTNFSVRFKTSINEPAGWYYITLGADDGNRLTIGTSASSATGASVGSGATQGPYEPYVINNFSSNITSSTTYYWAGGTMYLTFEYYQGGGAAVASFNMCEVGTGTQSFGTYPVWNYSAYNANNNFTDPDFVGSGTFTESSSGTTYIELLNDYFNSSAPAISTGSSPCNFTCPSPNYSVRFRTNITLNQGVYVFTEGGANNTAGNDDGAGLTINSGANSNTNLGTYITGLASPGSSYNSTFPSSIPYQVASTGAYSLIYDYGAQGTPNRAALNYCIMNSGVNSDLNSTVAGTWAIYAYNNTNSGAYLYPVQDYAGYFTTGTSSSTGASFSLTGANVASNITGTCGKTSPSGSHQYIKALLSQSFTQNAYSITVGTEDNYSISFNGGQTISGAATATSTTVYLSGTTSIIYTANDQNGASPVYNVTIAVANPVAGTLTTGTNCSGGGATLYLNGNTGYVQFQSSPDGSTWSNIGSSLGQNNPSYNVSTGTTTYYRAVVTSNGTSVNSNVVLLPGTAGDQVSYGTNGQWIGYLYANATGSTNSFTPADYVGWVTEGASGNPDFTELWGGTDANPPANYPTLSCVSTGTNYSIRYKTAITEPAGFYYVTIGSDDGSRLYISQSSSSATGAASNNPYGTTYLVNDGWGGTQGYTTASSTVYWPGGTMYLVYEYYQGTGGAEVSFNMCQVGTATDAYGTFPTWNAYAYDNTSVLSAASSDPDPAGALTYPAGNYTGYFTNNSPSGTYSIGSNYTLLNDNWAGGSPRSVVTFNPTSNTCNAAWNAPTADWSARFKTTRTYANTGYYYYTTPGNDDGAELDINGTAIIANFSSGAATYTGTTYQSAGTVNMEYQYQQQGGGSATNLTECQMTGDQSFGTFPTFNVTFFNAYNSFTDNNFAGYNTFTGTASNPIAQNFGGNTPALTGSQCGKALSGTNISARFRSNQTISSSGLYVFSTVSNDDGAGLTINSGTSVNANYGTYITGLSCITCGAQTQTSAPQLLNPGTYSLIYDWTQGTGGSVAELQECKMSPPSGDLTLSTYGSGSWNVYVYNAPSAPGYPTFGAGGTGNFVGYVTAGSANTNGANFTLTSSGNTETFGSVYTLLGNCSLNTGTTNFAVQALLTNTFAEGIYTATSWADDYSQMTIINGSNNYTITQNSTCCAAVSQNVALNGATTVTYDGVNVGGAWYFEPSITIISPQQGTLSSNQSCGGSSGNITLSLSNNLGYAQLYSSTDEQTWTAVGSPIISTSASSISFPSVSPSVTTFYRVITTSGSTVTSNIVTVVASGTVTGNVVIGTSLTLGGTININGDFTINSGVTVTVPQGCILTVNANNITINGTINADGAGYVGGTGGGGGQSSASGTQNCDGGGAGSAGSGPAAGGVGGNGSTGPRQARGGSCNSVLGVNTTCSNSTNGYNDGGGGGGAGGGGGFGGAGGAGGYGACGAFFSFSGSTTNPSGGSAGSGGGTGNGTSTGTDVGLGSGGGGGAGGGGGNTSGTSGSSGGNGGGGIALIASQNLTVASSAVITAQGLAGNSGGSGGYASGGAYSCTTSSYSSFTCPLSGTCCSNYDGAGGGGGGAGGGSGGEIVLEVLGRANILGSLYVNGGNGGTPGLGNATQSSCLCYNQGGGGGGAGRIKIFVNPCQNNVITPAAEQANGGTGGSGNGGSTGNSGGSGVINNNLTNPAYSAPAAGTASSNQTICASATPAAITASGPSGGTGSYQYQWYGAYANTSSSYNYIPVTGFNASVVANGASGAASNTTNADIDGAGNVFVATNFNPGSGICVSTTAAGAWPSTNSVTSTNGINNTHITYTLQPYGSGDNDLRVASGTSGTVTLTNPVSATTLYFLCLSGAGSSSVTAQVNFAGGTSQSIVLSVPDWCAGPYTYEATSQEYYRIAQSATTCSGALCQYMYEMPGTISPANYGLPITSITFTNSGSGIFSFFALGANVYSTPTAISGATSQNLSSAQISSYVSGTGQTTGTFIFEQQVTTGSCDAWTNSVNLTINPLPTATISGTTAVCVGATAPAVTFTGANATAPYTFSYNINGGSTQTVTTSSGNSVTVTAPTTSSGSYTYNLLSVHDASSTACSQTQTGAAIITVNPLPTASIIGSTAVCAGSSSPNITFTGANATAPYTFTYNINGGSSQTVSTISGNSITVPVSTASSGSFTYNLLGVQDASSTACLQAQTGTATVTVNPLPTALISGGTSVCQNATQPLVTFTGANGTAPYTFTYNINGATNQTITCSGTNSLVTLSAPTASTGTYNYNLVSVADASTTTCAQNQTGTATIIVDPVVSSYGTITASAGTAQSLCANVSPAGTFTVTGASGGSGTFSYQWYYQAGLISAPAPTDAIPGSWTPCNATNGTGYNAATFAPAGSPANISYACVVTPVGAPVCAGTATWASGVLQMTVGLPTATITGGNTSVCQGATVTLNASSQFVATWQWQSSPDNVTYTNISGATATTYLPVTTTPGLEYYHAIATYSSGSGCTPATSNGQSITVDAPPSLSTLGTTSICTGGSNTLTLSASGGIAPPTSYQWQYYNGIFWSDIANGTPTDMTYSVSTSGQSSTLTFTTTTSIATGTFLYRGRATFTGPGCTPTVTSNSGNLVIEQQPVAATITPTPAAGGVCAGQTISASFNSASGGSGTITDVYEYSTDGGNTFNPYTQNQAINTSTLAGQTIIIRSSRTASGSGCSTSAYKTVTWNVVAVPVASAGNTGPYVVGQTIDLTSSSTNGTSYQWSGPNSYTSNSQNPDITGATVGMSGVYTVTASNSTGCSNTASTTVVVTTTASYTWTGTSSSVWTDPTNWVPTAPIGGPDACAIDVIIPGSVLHNPVISGDGISVGNLQMNSGSQLTLSGANISVCKNLTGGTGSQAAVIGDGIVVLTGTSVQTFTGYFSMQELMLSNETGATMLTNSAVDLYTSLDLQTGNFDATYGVLTFKSNTVDSVAILDNFSNGYTGTLTGNITAERYYASSITQSQHYMGSPVNSPSLVSQFGASGTGGGSPVQDTYCSELAINSNSPYGNVFKLDQHWGYYCGIEQWVVETSGNAQNGLGYSVLKAGAGKLVLNGQANLDDNYQISGLQNDGWSNITMQNRPQSSGWQLLSNPYLATLDVSTVPAGFDNQIQVWYAEGPYANSYQAGLIGTDAVVAPFQGFMVHKTAVGGSATFTINATDRVRTPATFYQQNANELKIIAANTASGLLDQTTVAFNSAATDTFDAQYDAAKMAGSLSRHTIYSVNNNKWLSRNTLHDIETTSTVPVGFEPGKTGTFTFSFNGVSTFDPTSYIYLEDRTTTQWYNVRNGNYNFNADSADAWNRFVLHFTPPALINAIDATCNTGGTINIQQPGSAFWNYTLTDSSSNVVATGTLNQTQPVTLQVATGTYTLTLTDTNNYVAVKTIQVNGPTPVSAAFMVSADTVIPEQTVVLVANTPDAASYLWNFGNGTTATGADAMVSYAQPGVYVLSLLVTNDAGCSSTQTHSITVSSNNATGLNNLSGTGNISIWSNTNKVYVDFTELQQVDATVAIYNILGQEISNEHYTNSNIYQKEIDGVEAAYMVVMVRNADKITTRKVLITNSK